VVVQPEGGHADATEHARQMMQALIAVKASVTRIIRKLDLRIGW
jgi:hypothetical protein